MLMTSKMVALTFLDGQHNNLQALGATKNPRQGRFVSAFGKSVGLIVDH